MSPTGMAMDRGRSERDQRQRQRDDDALAHEIDDRHRIGIRAAEIEAKQAAGPVQKANGERSVEAHLVAQHLDLIGAGVQAQHKPRRIAGDDLKHGERHHGGQNQRGESDDEAFLGGRR